jgi:3-phosphoshikimate 1-carboxyvinyltransferase
MRGLKELRVKDGPAAGTADMLRANGVTVEIEGDDLFVEGRSARWRRLVATHGSPAPCRRW